MRLDDYQQDAMKTAVYPLRNSSVLYPALGLCGEAGELAEKVKKAWRNTGHMLVADYPEETVQDLCRELGDVLWYVAAVADELGIPLSLVAQVNLEKLAGRAERGTIKAEGDFR